MRNNFKYKNFRLSKVLEIEKDYKKHKDRLFSIASKSTQSNQVKRNQELNYRKNMHQLSFYNHNNKQR